MSLPIERWARQAVLLDKQGRIDPVADTRVLRDLDTLSDFYRAKWRRMEAELVESGAPLAFPEGLFAATEALPNPGDISVTSINGTAALWSTGVYSPFPVNAKMTPVGYRVLYAGNITTSTSPGNLGWDPRVGAGSTGGSAIAGTTLGASGNLALTASITGAFARVEGDVVIRQVGIPGANSPVYGMFMYHGTQDGSAGLAGPAAISVHATAASRHSVLFGGSTPSIDLTIAGGFSLGVVHTVATITHLVKAAIFASWN